MSQSNAAVAEGRPEVSVFWVPGCSSCLKAKEFVADLGLSYDYINVAETPEALEEVSAAGFRGAPVVRWKNRYVLAQSLDDLATFFGRSRNDKRLPKAELISRWAAVQDKAREVIAAFAEDELHGMRLAGPHADIKELAEHSFQVVESFLRQVEDDTIDARAIYLSPDPNVKTRADVLAYADRMIAEFHDWVATGGPDAMPERLRTHYGIQPQDVVLERGVWHMTQHARQLDHLAQELGRQRHIPEDLYKGLPLPKSVFS